MELAILLSPSDQGIAAFYARLTAAYLYLERYETAVEWGQKSLQKNVSWTGRVPYASALGHLGRREEAHAVCEDLRRLEPCTSVEFVQNRILMPHQPYMNHLLDGLRKSGLPEN